MENKLKQKMQRGEKVIGTFTHIGGGVAVECLGLAGMDFVVIDCEHAPFSQQDAMDMIRAAEIRGITPVVRVQDYTRPSLHRALNSGAKALIIPCMETMDEVKLLCEQGKFYNLGRHCFPYSRNSGWGVDSTGRLLDFFNENNENTLIVPQCETVGFLNHIEEILAYDGIDGIFVGPFDLSTDMGMPGNFTHPDFLAARQRILKAVKESGKFAWIYSPSTEAAITNFADGFDGAAVLMDTVVYTHAFKQLADGIRNSWSEQSK